MHFKITATILIIVTFALGLTVMLNYVKFEHTLAGLAESRLAFVAWDLRAAIETGLDLGLDLETMANTEAILGRATARDPQILSIVVFDERGRPLFQRGVHSAFTDTIPTAWREAMARNPDAAVWHATDAQALVAGTRLLNNFGRTVGGIVLRYDRVFYDRELDQAFAGLARIAAVILAVTSLVATLSVWLLFRGIQRSFGRLRTALEHLLTLRHESTFQPQTDSALEGYYAAAEQKSREIWQRLETAHRLLQMEQKLLEQKRNDS